MDSEKKSKDFRKSGIDSWDICDYRTYWQRRKLTSSSDIVCQNM